MTRTRSQGLSLDTEGDLDAKLLFCLLQHRDHDLWSVVDSKDDVFDSGLSIHQAMYG